MKKQTIRKIGKQQGVKNLSLFVRFFSRRFPRESNNILSYVTEWADRFNTTNPEVYMDTDSLRIYREELEREVQ